MLAMRGECLLQILGVHDGDRPWTGVSFPRYRHGLCKHSLRGVQLQLAEQCGFSANLACRVSARVLAVYFGYKPALQ